MMQVVQPRGLRRAAAAAYLGISPSHFDKELAAGNVPAPKLLFGVTLYDRHDLDALFDGKPAAAAANDNDADWWDRECATENRHT
ncbi:XRE family transcriptional regulator [Mesorhizobium hawassense]|uniref:XRE family transcriptional regulator n=1 Tax=Mesorhizobium hawassense TaxID=1209954 RepID=A0A330H3Q7_9HYPH|nr:XRE family transcriptional regulator [Mesorhizobium hawassense]RAZ83186.1 XRE family transcriptional regulator [Mesorhizobium hawassense]